MDKTLICFSLKYNKIICTSYSFSFTVVNLITVQLNPIRITKATFFKMKKFTFKANIVWYRNRKPVILLK